MDFGVLHSQMRIRCDLKESVPKLIAAFSARESALKMTEVTECKKLVVFALVTVEIQILFLHMSPF